MNIFTTQFEDVYVQTVRALRYNLLIRLAGSSANKFAYLSPKVAGLPLSKCEEKRKAEVVQLFNELLQAGVPVLNLPDLSSCVDFSGSSCNDSNAAFSAITTGILEARSGEAIMEIVEAIDARVEALENA